MNNITNEHDGRVCAVNQLALKALESREFTPYEEATNSRVQKVAELLHFCSVLNGTLSPEYETSQPVHANVCNVCQLADVVSSIADVLIGQGLDEVLDELKQELRLRQPDHCHRSLEEADKAEVEALPLSGRPLTPAANQLARPPLYAHHEQTLSDLRWQTMDRKLLAKRIPDAAAVIFLIGAALVTASAMAILFTHGIVPRIILVFGLLITAAGQNMGERAISDGHGE